MSSHTASAPHEIRANWRFVENGLAPYWTLSKFIRTFDGGFTDEVVELPTGPEGEEQRGLLSFGYHVGSIQPREQDSRDPEKGMWEINVKWRGPGEEKASFAIKPRWSPMFHVDSGDRITTPFDHLDAEEGIYVQLQGSNMEPDDYLPILQTCCRELAEMANERWNPQFFASITDGTIGQHERYYRTRREAAKKITDQDGIFSKLQQLYAAEEGTHVTLDLDNSEIQGYQNRVWLPNHSVGPVPGLNHGVKLENYHPEHVQDDGPLRNPKVEALFKLGNDKETTNPKLNGETVDWEDRNELVTELEEFLINVHRWVALDVDPDSGTFVEDDHFDVTPSERRIEFYEDPTPEMEVSRESALVRTLADANERDVTALEAVISDGGKAHYEDVADEVGSVSTVYRALESLNDILESQNGTISFVCSKMHQDLREVFDVAKGQVEYARKATERMLRLADDKLQNVGGALQEWVQKYGVEVEDSTNPHKDKVVKVHSVLSRFGYDQGGHDASEVITQGYRAWDSAGFDRSEFREAEVYGLDEEGSMSLVATSAKKLL